MGSYPTYGNLFLLLIIINLKHLIFIPSLILGTLIAISASSWFSAWVGLEINLIRIAPLLINKTQYPSVEATIKYFISQAIASSILIFFFFSSSKFQIISIDLALYKNIVLVSLLTKAGVAPLHFWFPQVIICSEWFQSFILLTWQRISPFILLSFISTNLLLFFIISSAIIGAIGGINQNSFILILTYSSILHSRWMITLVIINEPQWWVYFVSYSLIALSVIFILCKFNVKRFTEIHKLYTSSKIKLLFLINFLSIAGLPPLLGFIIKFLAINSIFFYNSFPFIIPLTLITTSFLSFYFYLRMTYSFLFNSTSPACTFRKSRSNSPSFKLILVFASSSLIGRATAPFIYLLT